MYILSTSDTCYSISISTNWQTSRTYCPSLGEQSLITSCCQCYCTGINTILPAISCQEQRLFNHSQLRLKVQENKKLLQESMTKDCFSHGFNNAKWERKMKLSECLAYMVIKSFLLGREWLPSVLEGLR